MKTVKKAIITSGAILATAFIVSASTFATTIRECIDNYYPNLSLEGDSEHPLKCASVADIDGNGGYITIYAKTSNDCASASRIYSDIESCGGKKTDDDDGEDISPAPIETIGATTKDDDKKDGDNIGTVVAIISIIAVVMVAVIGTVVTLMLKQKKDQTSPTQPMQPDQYNQQNPYQQDPYQQQPPQN